MSTGAREFVDFSRLGEGDSAEIERVVTEADVRAFAALSGDDNPIHVDEAFGRRAGLGGTVAHGMLSAAFISGVIGTVLPGPGALWISQSLEFRRPVRVGDCLRIAVRVKRTSPAERVLVVEARVVNQLGEQVVDGEGRVKMLGPRSEEKPMERQGAGVALVTGASRGIGAAIARRLGAAGCRVAVNFLRRDADAKGVVEDIRAAGGEAMLCRADVCRADEVGAMVEAVTAAFGTIDVLVSNAGGAPTPAKFAATSWSDVEREIATHVGGAFHCTQSVLSGMVERRFGRIILIGSVWTDAPAAGWAPYVVAKHALVGLCRSLAVEYGPYNIAVNVVAPGVVETDQTAGLTDKARALAKMQTPLRRLGTPDDVAEIAVFLATTPQLYMTGGMLRVSGGQVMA